MTTPAPPQDQQKDHPDVVIFPPVLLLATIALGVILDQFFPLGILARQVPAPARQDHGQPPLQGMLLNRGAVLPGITMGALGGSY